MFGKHRLITSITLISFILAPILADRTLAEAMRLLTKQGNHSESSLDNESQSEHSREYNVKLFSKPNTNERNINHAQTTGQPSHKSDETISKQHFNLT
jgi:hypothetical protein